MKKIILCVLMLFIISTGLMFSNDEENPDLSKYESFKVFVMNDGLAYSDYRITTVTYKDTDIHIRKNDSETFFTVFYKKRSSMGLSIVPKGEDILAITKLKFNLSSSKGSKGGPPSESMIVSLEKPICTLPLYKSNGDSLSNSNSRYNAFIGKLSDDPWVKDYVNVTANGLIHLQKLKPGDYWLEVKGHKIDELNVPSRIIFKVTDDGEVEGLGEYIRYSAPDADVYVSYKTGADKYPYTAGFNIYKIGSATIKDTWLGAYWTREGIPAKISGLSEGRYKYKMTSIKEKDKDNIFEYDGILDIKDGEYNFNFPAYYPYEIRTQITGKKGVGAATEGNLKISGSITIEEEQEILEYNDILNFEKFNVNMFFPYRKGQPDEFVTIRTLDRVKYGKELVELGDSFETVLNSPTYEVLVTDNGDTSQYEIAFPIDTSKVINMKNISCYAYDTDKKKWFNIGGRVNYTNNSIRVIADDYQIFVVAEGNPKFVDLSNYEWASIAINSLTSKGVISGYGNSVFKPQNGVSKAEFITLLIKVCRFKGDEDQIFEDTEGKWYQKSMSIAVDFKLIDPINNKVEADKLISREEMAVILDRTLMAYPEIEPIRYGTTFNDRDQIDSSAIASVNNVYRYGLINVDNNDFYPKNTANRAEAVQAIYSLLNLLEKTN